MPIETRRDLYNLLEIRMKKTYENLEESQELELEENLLKTYIIESTLDSIYSLQKINGFKIKINETKDNSLHVLKVYKNDKLHSTFYVDTSDNRFWIFHTLSKSEKTDQFMNKFIFSISNNLDFPWFDTHFLETLVGGGIFRGFTLKFEEKILDDDKETPIESLSMRLWGDAAPKILNALRNDPNLKYSTALSGVGLKYMFDSNNDFVIENITFNAKFTARGTTVNGHMFIVKKVMKEYKRKLEIIERNSIKYDVTDIGYKIRGEPAVIEFKKEIQNLDKLLDKLLSSTKPFRLWGLKKQINKDYYKAVCVDLHTTHKLTLEVSPQWIRVYLPSGACGNTVLRLLTNIQHYYDSEAKLVVGDDEII